MAADDLANNGLRNANGALIGGLDALEYNAGFADYAAGNPPPDFSTVSYDLGRQLGARRAAEKAEVAAWIKRDSEKRDAAMKEMLPPNLYADYRKQIDAINNPKMTAPQE